MNLLDLRPRTEPTCVSDIFPRFDLSKARELYSSSPVDDPHQTLLHLAQDLWQDTGYARFLDLFGFHDQENGKFSGHCHQITPILGTMLLLRGWPGEVSYLECYRIDHQEQKKIDPKHERDPGKVNEFMRIGRIPYCCLRVKFGQNNEERYMSGKHIIPSADGPQALLRPNCYEPMIGLMHHQDDPTRSGIYLHVGVRNPFTWFKQTKDDPEMEYYRAYLTMPLRLS